MAPISDSSAAIDGQRTGGCQSVLLSARSLRANETLQANSYSQGDLCSKGYARMNEWEAHESSYDHQHKKALSRLTDP